jgi:hypothetical protein
MTNLTKTTVLVGVALAIGANILTGIACLLAGGYESYRKRKYGGSAVESYNSEVVAGFMWFNEQILKGWILILILFLILVFLALLVGAL